VSSSFVCLAQGLGFVTIMSFFLFLLLKVFVSSLWHVHLAQGLWYIILTSLSSFPITQGFCDEFIANGNEV
jgi:hypothetical protein